MLQITFARYTSIFVEHTMLQIICCKIVPKIFKNMAGDSVISENLYILKTGISRSVASMTEHHPDLATVIHEQNVESYLQNWNVKEYECARCPDMYMDKFQDFEEHCLTLRSDLQPCLVMCPVHLLIQTWS
jgi:hypothetical protein